MLSAPSPLSPRWQKALKRPSARRILWGWSFLESSIFPIPPDPGLITMTLAAPQNAYRLARLVTIASVLGGVAGYALGAFFVDAGFLQSLLPHHHNAFAQLTAWYHEYGALVVFMGGFTIIPYKLITIFSGMAGMNVAAFVVMSVLSRGLRFYLEAFLVRRFGADAIHFIARYLGWRMLVGVSIMAAVGIMLWLMAR